MSKYKAAIFDVDGTLLYTKPGIMACVRKMLKDCNVGELTKEQERFFMGPPIQRSLQDVFGVTPEKAQECAEYFRDMYKTPEYLFQAEPYEGILKLMKDLQDRGIRTAVATYKREDYAIDICKHFGIADFADVVHGSDNFNKLTKADIIKLCLSDMGITDNSTAVMLGDSDNDAIGAEGIGCPFIGVTYGFGFTKPEDVMQFPYIGIASHPDEILQYFLG